MKRTIGLAAIFGIVTLSASAQDAEKGEAVFKKCASCHQVGKGAKNRVGPVLTSVVGRAAGSYEGYKYGKSMQAAGAAGLIWDTDSLAEYLTDPTRFLRAYLEDPKAKAKMKFKLKKEGERRDVIAYLARFSDGLDAEAQIAPSGTIPIETAENAICVRNRNTHDHLFAVEASGAERRVAMLKPGETLCTQTTVPVSTGTVSVFEHADELEGCSRIVPLGQTEDMLKYVDFDRCFWSSNT